MADDYDCSSDTSSDVDISTDTSDTSSDIDTSSDCSDTDCSDTSSDCDLSDDGSDDLPESDTDTSDSTDDLDTESTDDTSDVSESENSTDDSSDELPVIDTDTTDTSDDADTDSTNDNTDVSEGDDLTNDGSDELPEGDSDTMDTTKDTETNEFEETSELSENESLNNDGSDDLPKSADDTTKTIENIGTNDGGNMSEKDDLSNDGSDELPDTNTETNTLNQFGDAETLLYDESKTDLQNAQDDLDFANSQRDEYQRAVEAGEIEPNEDTELQLQDSIDHAQSHLSDIENGQAYSYDRPSEYWASPEGREIAGDLYGSGIGMATQGVGKATGVDVPPGDTTISEPSKNFGGFYGENYGYKDIGRATDFSKDLMENAHGTYDTEGDHYMQENFMRDANRNPITAEQGKDISFDKQEMPTTSDTKEFYELKNDYFDDLKSRSEYPDTINVSIKENDWKKIDPEQNGEMREEFGNSKNRLISDWEARNNQKWPTYREDVYSPNGKLIRRAGDKYDAHHIQPLTYDGKNSAENITPLHASEHFDKQGVHSPNSPFGKMEKLK